MRNLKEAPVKSVRKALDLLTLLAFEDPGGEGKTLGELSAARGIPNNTAHNLLRSLIACGYAEQLQGGRYAAGPMCRRMGMMNQVNAPWVEQILLPAMQKLSQQIGAESLFVTLGGGERIQVASANGNQAIRVDIRHITEKPFYALPTGRVLASYADEQALQDVIRHQGYPGDVWGRATNDKKLGLLMAEIRQQGFERIDEVLQGIVSFSVPVLDSTGNLIGALGTYMPAFACPPERDREVLSELKETATHLCSNYTSACTERNND